MWCGASGEGRPHRPALPAAKADDKRWAARMCSSCPLRSVFILMPLCMRLHSLVVKYSSHFRFMLIFSAFVILAKVSTPRFDLPEHARYPTAAPQFIDFHCCHNCHALTSVAVLFFLQDWMGAWLIIRPSGRRRLQLIWEGDLILHTSLIILFGVYRILFII